MSKNRNWKKRFFWNCGDKVTVVPVSLAGWMVTSALSRERRVVVSKESRTQNQVWKSIVAFPIYITIFVNQNLIFHLLKFMTYTLRDNSKKYVPCKFFTREPNPTKKTNKRLKTKKYGIPLNIYIDNDNINL